MTPSSTSRPTAIRSRPPAGTVPRLSALMMLILSSRRRLICSCSSVFIDFSILSNPFLFDNPYSLQCRLLDELVHYPDNPAGAQQFTQVHLTCFPVRPEEFNNLLLLFRKPELIGDDLSYGNRNCTFFCLRCI